MDTSILFSQMIQMFLMIFLGYFLRKVKILDQVFTGKLTTLLLSVCMPCLILNSVIGRTGERDLAAAGQMFAIAVVLYVVLLPLLSLILVKVLRFPKKQQGIYMFMFTFSNVGFMGFPLVNAVFGSDAIFYTAIINIIFTVANFTIGVLMMHMGQDTQAKLDPKLLLTPGVILSLLAILLYLLDLTFPQEIVSVTASVGNMTTPAAMLCIGSTLASMQVKEVLNDWRVYLFSVIKQVLLPLALLPLIRLAVSSEYLQQLLYLLILTPVANSAVLLATEYGFDEKLAAKGVFVSTVLSVVTIPLMAQLI
jgi:hypothetical protein